VSTPSGAACEGPAATVAPVDATAEQDLFGPPGGAWRRVSPRLATARRLLVAAAAAVAASALLVVAMLGLVGAGPAGVVGVLLLLVGAWAFWLVGRTAARWGYAEQEDELHITSGALFRRLVVVPYGRMQYVDVQSGPLDQLYGIAQLRLHTASPGTSARIPGLPADEAARLRDRLTAMGETQAAGL
jgi:membrane protein YdbS with pleckstrin-like domain